MQVFQKIQQAVRRRLEVRMNMSEIYNHREVEQKWQKIWDDEQAFATSEDYSKPKYYALVEFPYPSGQGLHVGHPRPYTAMDIVSRKRRMQGYNVLFPMGWDAFGLPTENFAIANKIHPKIVTKNNVGRFKEQLHSLGYSFDWNREINTTDPNYYHWTQWIFLQLFKKGLAYKAEMPINWCTSCKVGLANEEVVNGVCERCGAEVVRKVKSQWMLKITDYAEKLIEGLEGVDYVEKIAVSQKNWIGKSKGAEVDFSIAGKEDKLRVYTTRCDTLFGATYMVVSPEHPILDKYKEEIKNWSDVESYREQAAKKSDFERSELAKEKTGVVLDGLCAVNPVNQKEIPIFVSDYVLMSYGTGAIMAVPAHDERDWDFAKKFHLPIVEVVSGGEDVQHKVYTDVASGILVNSDFLNGMPVDAAKERMIQYLEAKGIGQAKTNYKLRDWVFSRQRYWGEPIPVVYCEKCGYVAIPESELPLELPEVDSYMPTDTGESPLSAMTDWVNTVCPCCQGAAKRETDTMPQWAGSSWYFLRYTDPKNDKALASKEALEYWMPVDWYNGGMEHVTRHVIYSRFWHHFLYDIGVVNTPEPYAKRSIQGLILGPDGDKMSKSKGNVVDPLDIVKDYGADTLRTYVLFMGDYSAATPWNDNAVKGCKRFLERVSGFTDLISEDKETQKLETPFHKTIKKVSSDLEDMKFNTAIAALMTLTNDIYNVGKVSKEQVQIFAKLLCPIAPHVCEEIWEVTGGEGFLSLQPWPQYEESKTVDAQTEIGVQINGKLRGTVVIPTSAEKEEVFAIAKADARIASLTEGKTFVKEIYVPGRVVNFVVK